MRGLLAKKRKPGGTKRAHTKSTKRKRIQKQISSKISSANSAPKAKDNDFEMVSTRPKKHLVYGQRGLHYSLAAPSADKSKGKVNVAKKKAAAVKERRESILVEYRNQFRSNQFFDRRLGERDRDLDPEEKQLLRYQRQRQKEFSRKSIFNLSDDEDDGGHVSAPILANDFIPEEEADFDTQEAEIAGEEEEDEFFTIKTKTFEGGVEVPVGKSGPKTRREILSEIIAKNRYYRGIRARDREAYEGELNEIDETMDDLMPHMEVRNKHKAKAEAEGAKQTGKNKKPGAATNDPNWKPKAIPNYDDYDAEFRAQSLLTRRARAETKNETPAALVRAEIRRLQELEDKRQDAIKGFNEHSSRPSEAAKDHRSKRFKRTTLDKDDPSNQMPFTFSTVPGSRKQLEEMTQKWGVTNADMKELLYRLRVCNSVHTSQDNKAPLGKFLHVLIPHFVQDAAANVTAGSPRERLNVLFENIWKISRDVPALAGKAAQTHLAKLFLATRTDPGVWPAAAQLLVLHMIPKVFSTNEFRHPVVTPANLLLALCLSTCKISCPHDMLKGCAMVLLWLALRRHADTGVLLPEAVAFLQAALSHLSRQCQRKGETAQAKSHHRGFWSAPAFKIPGRKKGQKQQTKKQKKRKQKKGANADDGQQIKGALDVVLLLMKDETHRRVKDTTLKESTLRILLRVVLATAQAHVKLPSFPELFDSVTTKVKEVFEGGLCRGYGRPLQRQCGRLATTLAQMRTDHENQRCHVETKTVVEPLKQMMPNFDETGFNPRRSKDPRADYIKRMKSKVKQERKNVLRELRRDASFLAQVRNEEVRQRDAEHKTKMNKVMTFLQGQAADHKVSIKAGLTHGAGSGGGGRKKKKRF